MRTIYVLLLVVLGASAGCNSADTRARIVPLDRADALNRCNTIIEGHVIDAYGRSSLTVAEDFLGPEPSSPKNGYMSVFKVHVDKHNRGWTPAEVIFKAQDTDSLQSKEPWRGQLPVPKGSRLRMGWNDFFGIRGEILIVILREPSMP